MLPSVTKIISCFLLDAVLFYLFHWDLQSIEHLFLYTVWECKAEFKMYLVFICLCNWPNLFLKIFFLPVLCFVIKREHVFVGLYLDILFYFIGLFVSVVSLRFYFLFICCCYLKYIYLCMCVFVHISSKLAKLTYSF